MLVPLLASLSLCFSSSSLPSLPLPTFSLGSEKFPYYASEGDAGHCAVLIPDWDGANAPEFFRADQLTTDSISGSVLSMYPDTAPLFVADSGLRGQLVSRVRGNASYAADIIDAGLDELRANHGCDDFVIIGFCSGGTIVLNYVAARPEIRADLKGIVSIHGGLTSRDAIDADRSSSSTRILVLSGGDDDAQSNVADLEADLDSTGLTWEMTRYADTPHAWTNVASSRYRYRADSRTWGSVDFFLRDVLLGEVEAQRGASADRAPHIARIEVNYTSPVDGTNLSSYLYWDKSTRQARPLVLVAPDWTGLELEADGYEMTRAEMLAAEGFAAFGMDIFGEGYHHVPSIETRISLVNQYLSSPDLVLDRYESALAAATGLPPVDATKVALFGYCFGGSASFHVHALTEAGHALRGVVSRCHVQPNRRRTIVARGPDLPARA